MADISTTLLITVKVALCALALISVPAILLGYLLARFRFFGKTLLETLVALPLVLPPTAVGYLLLRLLSVDGPLGSQTLGFDLGMLLTWKGATLASAIMAWPLVVRTARVSFEGVDPRLEQIARTLGAGRLVTFWRVSLPICKNGLLAALILGFTRALGEFGATVIVAGNLPGQTQTLALAIFSAEQSGRTDIAEGLLWVAVCLGFAAVWLVERLSHQRPKGART